MGKAAVHHNQKQGRSSPAVDRNPEIFSITESSAANKKGHKPAVKMRAGQLSKNTRKSGKELAKHLDLSKVSCCIETRSIHTRCASTDRQIDSLLLPLKNMICALSLAPMKFAPTK
jgi:hypothetical protein